MVNEALFVITVLGVFAFVFSCFFLGRRWLYAAIVVNLIAISVFGAEVVSIFGQVTNVGNIFYAGVFFAGQLLVEHYGKEEGKKTIWLGFSCVLFLIVVEQIIVRYIPVAQSALISQAIKSLFVFVPRIALASLLAYLCSQSINIYLYSYLNKFWQKKMWLKSITANFIGQFIDSIIFFSIAFVGVLSPAILRETTVVGFATKFIVGLIAVPLLYLSYRFKTNKEILEQEAQAILSGIGDGIAMTDIQGKIILINKAFSEMLGWESDEVTGKMMTDVIRRQDEEGKEIDYQERILTKVLEGEKVATSMTNHSYFVRKDETKFPVAIMVTPVLIDDKIMGAVEVFRDVTKEKEIEMLRTDFLSLASHQLRTPLSGTRWLIETLQKETFGTLNPKQREYVDDLYKVNARLIQLASDTLNVLNIQSGVIKIKKETFTPNDVFKEIQTLMHLVSVNRNIVIEINANKDNDTELVSDFKVVKNIMESLVSNAINYSKSGQKIVLSASRSASCTIFSVKDNGVGIPQDEQKRIFERFYRASNAQKVKTDGTGLGLYTAHILAEKIGAEITFDSKEGEGSTFYLKCL